MASRFAPSRRFAGTATPPSMIHTSMADLCVGPSGFMRWMGGDAVVPAKFTGLSWKFLAFYLNKEAVASFNKPNSDASLKLDYDALARYTSDERARFVSRDDVCALAYVSFFDLSRRVKQITSAETPERPGYLTVDEKSPSLLEVLSIPSLLLLFPQDDASQRQFARLSDQFSHANAKDLRQWILEVMPFLSSAVRFIERSDAVYGSYVATFLGNLAWTVSTESNEETSAVTHTFDAMSLRAAASVGLPMITSNIGRLDRANTTFTSAGGALTFELPPLPSIFPFIYFLETNNLEYKGPTYPRDQPLPDNLTGMPWVSVDTYYWYRGVCEMYTYNTFFIDDGPLGIARLFMLKHAFGNSWEAFFGYVNDELFGLDEQFWNADVALAPQNAIGENLLDGLYGNAQLILRTFVSDENEDVSRHIMARMLACVCLSPSDDLFTRRLTTFESALPDALDPLRFQDWVASILFGTTAAVFFKHVPERSLAILKCLSRAAHRLMALDLPKKQLTLYYDVEADGTRYFDNGYAIDLLGVLDLDMEVFEALFKWLLSKGSPLGPSEAWRPSWNEAAIEAVVFIGRESLPVGAVGSVGRAVLTWFRGR